MISLKNPWVRLGSAVFFLGGIFAIVRIAEFDYSHLDPDGIRDRILAFGLWAPVIYVVFYTLRPLVLFPAGVLSALGGVIFGRLWGTVYIIIGATLSALAEFFIARYFGRGAIARLLKGRAAAIDEAIERNGFKTVFLIRIIPNVAYDIQNYSLGLTRVTFRDYFLGTVIGIIPGAFAFAYLGASVIEIITDPGHIWKIGVVIVIFAGILYAKQLLRRKSGTVIPQAATEETDSPTTE
ncbi:MAG: TVP38/TMEM64 family protein [Candidatus Omnitrophica bacterium]|nr:TVP38/TMEM64 family protein [Candidatus Omnitrophota bacterium]